MAQHLVLIALLGALLLAGPALALPHASAGAAAAGLHPGEALRPASSRHHRGAEILGVPGYKGELPSRHFGGYITVDEERGRHLYFYFVQSERSPSRDPLVLWLNGGPGCSSMDGFVYEHGPFTFGFQGGKDSTGRRLQELELRRNPYSWSRVANMLYVDSPAGVGLSYYENDEDKRTNDTHTAADMNTFLRRWLEAFPEFQGSDFFVSGESYAGVYVPLVAQAVLDGNEAGQQPALRLRGYLVGNGVTDEAVDGDALVPFAAGKSLISRELHQRTHNACGGFYWNASEGSACDRALDEVYHAVSGINIYDILEPCYHGHNPYTWPEGSSSAASAQRRRLQQEQQQQGSSAAARAELGAAVASHRGWPLLGGVRDGPVPGFGELLGGGGMLGHIPPCVDSREMWAFCNDPAVREAIHAQPIHEIGAFDECTNGQRIHYTHDRGSMLPVHADLINRGLTALVYSGDHDMAVPHTGSEAWTSALGARLGLVRPWAPWHIGDHQVAGYSVHYRGLVYATVRGAGHMVPQSKPAEALEMFSRFLERMQM
ncbi:hypothetical protein ABPG75_006208 [Micractinium tetrahymenae]